MWLKTKIISAGKAPRKTAKDYLPVLTPELRAAAETQLKAAGINKRKLKITVMVWEVMLAYPGESIVFWEALKEYYLSIFEPLAKLFKTCPQLAEDPEKLFKLFRKTEELVGQGSGLRGSRALALPERLLVVARLQRF